MSNSRWSRWVDHSEKKKGFSSFLKEANQPGGNPTGTGIETPAQKAKRMGLMPDGHGAYSDPQTGQIVARTVNGELVFYDQGPTGGATSDGEGGGDAPVTGGGTAPTYRDPDTGAVVVPPAQPKNKAEKDAVPDPVPATAPAGYQDAMDKKKAKGQRKNELAARMSAAFDKNVAPYQEDPLASVKGRRDAVDAGIAAGEDPATAHEKIHGHEPASIDSNAALAATMGRVNDQGGLASITPDKDGTSLFAQDAAKGAESEAESGAESQPEPEAAPEPAEAPEAPVETEPTEQEVAQAQEAEKPGGEQTAYAGEASPENNELVDNLVGDITSKLANKKTGKLPGYAQKMIDKLNDPVARKQFGEYLDFTSKEEQKIAERWDELSKVTDTASAERLLTEGMGMVTNDKGQLEFRPVEPGMREFMSLAKSNTEKGYRGLQFRELVELAKPEVQERLNNPDRQRINAESIINPDVSWEDATALYDRLSPSAKNAFNKLGGADAMREAFDPKVPVYYLKDGEGKATGLTNIDVMAKTDPEMYAQQFEKTGGRARGIFLLQKILATGGKDQLTGLPNFLTPQSGTVDHLEGRSQEMADKTIRKDSPVNMGIVSNSVNWAKADAADNEGNKDTIPGLNNVANSYASGSINGYGKKLGGGEDNMYNTWLSQRIGGVDIRDSKAAQTTQTEPDSLDSFMTSPIGKAGGVVNRLADAGSIGYDIRNMSMYYPRDDHDTKYDQNSWSGNPRKGSNRGYYTPLDGWRKSVLSGAVYGGKINDMVESHREALESTGKMKPEQVDEELKKYKKNYVKYHFSMPMRATASAWTMGLISREEYINQLRSLSDKSIEMIADSHPQHVEQLKAERDESLNTYLEEINKHQGEDELNSVSEDWLMKNISANPVVNVLYSQSGREAMAKKYPKVLEAFDAAVADGTIASKSLAVGKGKASRRLVDPSTGEYYEGWSFSRFARHNEELLKEEQEGA